MTTLRRLFFEVGRIAVVVAGLAAVGCATDRPLVKGLFTEEGVIRSTPEQEEWGTRTRVVVQPIEF